MLLTKDQFHAIESLHKTHLTTHVSEHYADRIGSPADVDIAFVDQTTFGEIIQSLGERTISYTFTLAPLGPVVVSYVLPIAYALIRHEMDETPDGELTESQREVMNGIFKRDLAGIEAMWSTLGTVKAEDIQMESNPQALDRIVDRPATTCLTAFEIHFPNASGLLNFSYPIRETLETIVPKLA